MSTFTWLDYFEHERRQAMEVIDLFGEDETRDELGLGTIRDAFADLLFPGTSTIQTRARYFLFVPWAFRDLERRRRTASAQCADRARAIQGKLRDALIAGGPPPIPPRVPHAVALTHRPAQPNARTADRNGAGGGTVRRVSSQARAAHATSAGAGR